MNIINILDEVISGLLAEEVPAEFIVMAKVVGLDGIERTLRGDEMVAFLSNQERQDVASARVILDVRAIRMAMLQDVNAFFADLDRRVRELDN